MKQNDIIIIYAFTGLNSTKMSELFHLFGATNYQIDLPLLKIDHMVKIINDLKTKYNIKEKESKYHILEDFLSVLLGNPRLFSCFLSQCSQYEKNNTIEVEFFPVIKKIKQDLKTSILFSIKGFKTFIEKNYLNDKNIMWNCMSLLYDGLKKTSFKSIFNKIDCITNFQALHSLLNFALFQEVVNRNTLLPNSNYKIGDLEQNGYIYLEPIQNDTYQVRMTLIVMNHINNILLNYKKIYFPILYLNYKLTPEENELSDLNIILTKILRQDNDNGMVNLNFLLKKLNLYVETSSINPLVHYSTTRIQDFQKFYEMKTTSFINGKGSSWGDSGIKLKIYGANSNTIDDYFFIIIQSKRKEKSNNQNDISEEFQKIYKKEEENFFHKNVLFMMISDGNIIDQNSVISEYNCIGISRDDYPLFFSQTFSNLKILKSQDLKIKEEPVIITSEIKKEPRRSPRFKK